MLTDRRSFIKILAGAAALAACPPALASLCNQEAIQALPSDASKFVVDPYPLRFKFVDGKYELVPTFELVGNRARPNPDYVNSTNEAEIWFSPSQNKYYPLIVSRRVRKLLVKEASCSD